MYRVNGRHSSQWGPPLYGIASFRFRGGLGMIYSRNSRVLGDVYSPALGLLVPECNVALALWTVQRSWLPHGSTTSAGFLYHACVCVSVRQVALVHVSACTQGTMPPGIPEIAIWGETHPRNHPSLITYNSTCIKCASIHACVRLCVCVYACICT